MPVPNSSTTTLTASGSVSIQLAPLDDAARVVFSGTYAGLTARLQASRDGVNYVDVASFQENIGAFVANPLTLNTANLSYVARGLRGYGYFQVVCAFTSGSVVVGIDTAPTLGSSDATINAQTNSLLTAIALGMSNLTDTDLQAAVGNSF